MAPLSILGRPTESHWQIRAIEPGDAPGLNALIEGLPPQDRLWRFHGVVKGLTPQRLRAMTSVDGRHELAMVALAVPLDGQSGAVLVGDARFVVDPTNVAAEIAIMVASGWRRSGIAAHLLAAIAESAARFGVERLYGFVMQDNEPMLELALRCGFRCLPDEDDWRLVRIESDLSRSSAPATWAQSTANVRSGYQPAWYQQRPNPNSTATRRSPAMKQNLHSASSPTSAGPRLALVLGSGGVRSIAAVGIAEVLRKAGIAPDLVVGCSSGALFGATIAAGMSSEEAVHRATTLWSQELTEQPRWRAYPQLVAPRLAGFDSGFSLRDDRLIAQRIAQAFGDARLETLPVALRVAATDARTGESVLLTQGRVVDALRASMALPFVFPSVKLDGRLLVDGVISDPLPVAAAADADIVVTLGFHGSMPRRVDRASRMVVQLSTALINNLQQARLNAARATGRRMVCIELKLDRHVGLWETAAMPALYEAGRDATAARLPEIMALLTSHGEQSAA